MTTVLNNLKGTLPQNFLKQIFEMLNLVEVKASDLKKEDEIIEHINVVNMEQVKDIINKVFNIENLAVCIVGKDVEGVQI